MDKSCFKTLYFIHWILFILSHSGIIDLAERKKNMHGGVYRVKNATEFQFQFARDFFFLPPVSVCMKIGEAPEITLGLILCTKSKCYGLIFPTEAFMRALVEMISECFIREKGKKKIGKLNWVEQSRLMRENRGIWQSSLVA